MLCLDREEVSFNAIDGLKCRAWLFVPSERPRDGAPVVVMAHGFGALKNFRLDAFAKYFAEHGIASLAFDYRHWGESEGTPRNLLNIEKQHEDYFSAIDFVAEELNKTIAEKFLDLTKPVVDPDRIGIWGSSFSGGHVMAVGATYKNKDRIKAIVAQVPFSDGFSSTMNLLTRQGIIWGSWVTFQGIYDKIRGRMGLKRHFVNIIYPKDQKGKTPRAVLITDECADYYDVIPEGADWDNKVNAAVAIEMMFYRPISYAKKLKVPVLGLYALKDTLCPPKDVKKLFEVIKSEKEIHELTGGHFHAYTVDFNKVASIELNFLKSKL